MVLSAVYIVLSIFLMIGLGMLLTHIGYIRADNAPFLSNLVTRVGLSAMIISKLFSQYSRQSLIESAPGIAAPFISLVLTIAVSLLAARVTRVNKARRGVFCCMFTFSNSVFIGLPVSMALFGEGVVPYTLLYYIANTVLFWSAGHAMMSMDGGRALFDKKNIKKLFPLPLLVFFSCAILILLGVSLPSFVLDAADYVGALVTPLSMFYTGYVIMGMLKRGCFRYQRGYLTMLLGRFAIAPAMLLITSRFIAMPELMRNALLIQAAMPVMSQTPIVAASCGADSEYAAGGIALSTLCSLIFIPAYMALTQYL